MTRIKRIHTDTIDWFFVFDQKGDTKILHTELTERQIGIRTLKSANIRGIRVICVPFDLMNTISSKLCALGELCG